MSVRLLSNDLQNVAKNELNEVPSRVPDDIQNIRDWLLQQKHLSARTDDQWILTFLRGCKFSLQKTKEKLDMFYTTRSLLPEIYGNRDPMLPEIQEILEMGLCLPLVKTDCPAGPRVILIRCPLDTSVSFTNVVKVTLMITDILVNEDDNFIVVGPLGWCYLVDMNLHHMVHADLNVCKKVAICIQQGYPIRPKGFHWTDGPSFFETFLNAIKPFMTGKLKERIAVHSSCTNSDFITKFSPAILPKECGGSGASIEEMTSYWKKKVESYRDWFLEEAKYGCDETKRSGIHKTSDELFGVEGSFRRLEVD